MPYRYKKNKKKKARLKPVPILILLVAIAAIITIIIAFSQSNNRDDGISSDISTSTQVSSIPPSSEDAKSSEESSNEASSEASLEASSDLSSDEISSDDVSSTPSSSVPDSSTADSSAPASSELPTVPTDTAIYNEVINTYDRVFTKVPTSNDPLWNLILLNCSYSISKDIPFEKVKFDSQYVDKRAAPAYKSMYDAAKAEGITLFLRSGYRSVATQSTNYNAAIQRYVAQGLSKADAIAKTRAYYTVPGHSEHHSGLAFDIITPEYHNTVYSLDDRFADTEAYKWLVENCAEYGFILRYPKEKQSITTINFEPWHYRYVGVDHAKAIMQNGLSLEEYIVQLHNAYDSQYGDDDPNALATFAESYPQTLI